jgi:hypothetical protein
LLPVELDAAGDAVVLAGEDVVLAEGVSFPVVGEEDSAEVGVAVEGDPHEVVGLAFVPVGGGPEVDDGGEAGALGAGAVDLDGEAVADGKAPEVVDDAELIVGDVIDAGETGQPVHVEVGVGLEEGGDLAPVLDVDVDARVFVLGKGAEDFFAEALLKTEGDLGGGHGGGDYRGGGSIHESARMNTNEEGGSASGRMALVLPAHAMAAVGAAGPPVARRREGGV